MAKTTTPGTDQAAQDQAAQAPADQAAPAAAPAPNQEETDALVTRMKARGAEIVNWIKAVDRGQPVNMQTAQDIIKEHKGAFYAELDKIVPTEL